MAVSPLLTGPCGHCPGLCFSLHQAPGRLLVTLPDPTCQVNGSWGVVCQDPGGEPAWSSGPTLLSGASLGWTKEVGRAARGAGGDPSAHCQLATRAGASAMKHVTSPIWLMGASLLPNLS